MALTMKKGSNEVGLPSYMADLSLRQFASRWNARAGDNKSRTPAKLDADVDLTLPRQWAQLQPAPRLDAQGRICKPADMSMNWLGALSPGLEGVRLLVITVLVWGWNMRDEEGTEWSRLALDISRVLRILTQQAGPWDTNVTAQSVSADTVLVREGRKKSARKRCAM